jgi:WD40 repeat protein
MIVSDSPHDLAFIKHQRTDLCIFVDADLNVQKERHGSSVKRLVGHSGPVYGLSFSHDNKYLLSCSEDKTGKTALHVNANLSTIDS